MRTPFLTEAGTVIESLSAAGWHLTREPEPLDERARIEQEARLSDAYDALRAAILWLHGEYRHKPRSEFNAETWYRQARSGCVGLRDYLAARASEEGAE